MLSCMYVGEGMHTLSMFLSMRVLYEFASFSAFSISLLLCVMFGIVNVWYIYIYMCVCVCVCVCMCVYVQNVAMSATLVDTEHCVDVRTCTSFPPSFVCLSFSFSPFFISSYIYALCYTLLTLCIHTHTYVYRVMGKVFICSFGKPVLLIICVYLCIVYVCVHVCVCMCVYVCLCVCVCVCVCVCMCERACVCVCTLLYRSTSH